ncbi:hypothetical protein GCM10023310_69010 [Paenibacillus vulneris]|uniref:Uncharacterized protein n=1 Tax=Paenibacillus vulneris TaxID=1133364 RepID=A0ABW3UH67_9BACL
MLFGKYKIEGRNERANGSEVIISMDLIEMVDGETNYANVTRINLQNVKHSISEGLEVGKVYNISLEEVVE